MPQQSGQGVMSDRGTGVLDGRGWMIAAIVLALSAPARGEVPSAAHSLKNGPLPSAIGIVGASQQRPSSSEPVQPAALHPSLAPLAAAICRAPAAIARLNYPLLRTAQRLASRQPLTIVAIGSSSTAGAGASAPATSYPSRLAVELGKLYPHHAIVVINRGVNGEVIPDMVARFRTAVLPQHPQLVLWQLGTNSVLRDRPLKPHSEELHDGISELKRSGADVVLIDPQYAPKVLAKPEVTAMLGEIAAAAKDENVGLFRRFAVMRQWYVDQHRSFSAFVSPDGLHMNDWGYACWARLLAGAIAEAAKAPVASAAGAAAP